jgi:hypothetical protein
VFTFGYYYTPTARIVVPNLNLYGMRLVFLVSAFESGDLQADCLAVD